MTKLEKDSERIAAYIFNNMEPVERLAFEEELKKDADLASEYQFQLDVLDYLKRESGKKPDSENVDFVREQTIIKIADDSGRDIDDLAAERMISKHEKKYPDDFEVTSQERAIFQELLREGKHGVGVLNVEASALSTLRKWFITLSAAAAIIIAIWVITSSPWLMSPEKLFNRYYQPLTEASFVYRSGDAAQLAKFQEAVQFYRNEEYTASSIAFRELVTYDPILEDANLFLGLSLMGEELYNEAADQLESYLVKYSFYDSEASWYLALCYLKLEDFDNCIKQLQNLTSSPRRLGKDANELLRKLMNQSGN